MQAKVPQNVQMADKIVGPLTLRHMIIIGSGGGLAYLVYVILAQNYYWEVWLFPVAFIVIVTLLIAFVKIYNLSFGKFAILFMEYLFLPRKRQWTKSSAEIFNRQQIQTKNKKKKVQKKKKGEEAAKTIRKIDDLTKMIDSYNK